MLCELARTDAHRFRVLEPDSDQTKALRALTRAREDLVTARVALANQLRAELERFWPGPIGLFSALDSRISLAFLARYPSPQDARGLGEKRMAAFLKAHRYTNRKTRAQLLERLRSAPTGRAGEIETRTRRADRAAPDPHACRSWSSQIQELETEIAQALDAHPDGEIFRSFFTVPGRGDLRRRRCWREIGDCRAPLPPPRRDRGRRRPSPRRGRIGQTQDTRSSAGRATNGYATRSAPWRTAARRWNPWAADRYANARARGHNHRRALRTLGRAWSRIIWRCWQTHTPYDPARHTGLQQHITVTIPTT